MEKGICPTCGQHINGSYYEEGGENDCRFADPCRTCKHNSGNDSDFPCSKCIDNANAGMQAS